MLQNVETMKKLLTPYFTCFPTYLILLIFPITSYLLKLVKLLVYVGKLKLNPYFFFLKKISFKPYQTIQKQHTEKITKGSQR